LIIAVVALFILLYAGNIGISLINTRTLVAEQMHVHAQDTATSLALSVTQDARQGDMAHLETLFNAISDSGFYERIYFRNLDNEIITDRRFEVDVAGVPGWFIGLVDLSAAEGRAEVTSGWVRLGEVVVESHPGQAYSRLWEVMVQQLAWFTLATVLVCLLAFFALRILLRPLRRVEEQADAVCNQDFLVQERLPRTRELRRVVEAMNRMAVRLRDIYASQLSLIQRLQTQAYRDPVTGLSNRADFDARLASLEPEGEEVHAGALMIVAIDDLARINDKAGRDEGNRLLKSVGEQLSEAVSRFPGAVVARRQGPDFSVLVPDVTREEAKELAGGLFARLMPLSGAAGDGYEVQVAMGFTYKEVIVRGSELLAEADTALRRAHADGGNRWRDFSDLDGTGEPPVLARPVHDWRAFIEHCIREHAVSLLYQPVCRGEGTEVEGVEVLSRLLDDGKPISFGIVAPIAERLGLGQELDRLVLESLAVDVLSGTGGYYAVNLCTSSLQSLDFLDWLDAFLAENPPLRERLVFEVAEHAMHVGESEIRAFQRMLARHKSRLAIDHFGLEASAFAYLGSLPLYYIKVHRSFIRGIDGSAENQFYIQSLLQLARSRDIALIAEGIENEAEWRALLDLGVEYFQGYFIGHPEAVH
jgi:diguanylate cyclase (GGDEF)-like protein